MPGGPGSTAGPGPGFYPQLPDFPQPFRTTCCLSALGRSQQENQAEPRYRSGAPPRRTISAQTDLGQPALLRGGVLQDVEYGVARYQEFIALLDAIINNDKPEARFKLATELSDVVQDILKAEWGVLKRDIEYQPPKVRK